MPTNRRVRRFRAVTPVAGLAVLNLRSRPGGLRSGRGSGHAAQLHELRRVGSCVTGGSNSYTAIATTARQSGGTDLIAP